MMRGTEMHGPATGLALAIAGMLLAGTLAHACDKPEAAAAAAPAVVAMGGEGTPPPSEPQTPQTPQAPRTPEAEAPMMPYAGPMPMTAPTPPLEQPEAPRRLLPRAWFGFGLQCETCSASNSEGDSSVVWVFGSHPRVYSVETGGPAARAGIQRGDVITQINGVSLLTAKGGRLFGATRPGQVVRWTLLRDGRPRYALARAEARPERRMDLTDMREQMKRLNDVSNLSRLREELARLNERINRIQIESMPQPMPRMTQRPTSRQLRYAGVIGGAEIEVRGPGTVIVSENNSRSELVINTGESVVVIRAADLARELERAKDLEKKRERPR